MHSVPGAVHVWFTPVCNPVVYTFKETQIRPKCRLLPQILTQRALSQQRIVPVYQRSPQPTNRTHQPLAQAQQRSTLGGHSRRAKNTNPPLVPSRLCIASSMRQSSRADRPASRRTDSRFPGAALPAVRRSLGTFSDLRDRDLPRGRRPTVLQVRSARVRVLWSLYEHKYIVYKKLTLFRGIIIAVLCIL